MDWGLHLRRLARLTLAALGALPLTLVSLPAPAQDLSLGGGSTGTDDRSSASYGWQLQLHETFHPSFGASVSWINEGHVQDHHRDGLAGQLTYEKHWGNALGLRVGLGPYLYFDTAATGQPDQSENRHGVGTLLSLQGEWPTTKPWAGWIRYNVLHTPGDTGTRQLLLGVRRRFDPLDPAAGQAGSAARAGHVVEIYAGRAISNRTMSPAYRTIGGGYRLELRRPFDWSFNWYFDQVPNGRPHRLSTQLWLVEPLASRRFQLGAGLGPYMSFGAPRNPSSAPPQVRAALSVRATWLLTATHRIALSWSRVASRDDRDRDILLLVLGRRLR